MRRCMSVRRRSERRRFLTSGSCGRCGGSFPQRQRQRAGLAIDDRRDTLRWLGEVGHFQRAAVTVGELACALDLLDGARTVAIGGVREMQRPAPQIVVARVVEHNVAVVADEVRKLAEKTASAMV